MHQRFQHAWARFLPSLRMIDIDWRLILVESLPLPECRCDGLVDDIILPRNRGYFFCVFLSETSLLGGEWVDASMITTENAWSGWLFVVH